MHKYEEKYDIKTTIILYYYTLRYYSVNSLFKIQLYGYLTKKYIFILYEKNSYGKILREEFKKLYLSTVFKCDSFIYIYINQQIIDKCLVFKKCEFLKSVHCNSYLNIFNF